MPEWDDILDPYRAEAWAECARLARAWVDEDPYDLSSRALLASLLLRARQRPLALMQYERLMPLAVGRGELYRALGTQRRLDELHPPAQRHPDRYRAIQDWFRALTARGSGAANGTAPDAGSDAPPRALLDLPPEGFSVAGEQSKVVPLEPAPQTFDEAAGVLWVVYFGRVRWTIAHAGHGAEPERIAGAGDVIHLPAGEPGERRLAIGPETPCEVIHFDPGLAALLAVPPAGADGRAPFARPCAPP